MSHREKKENTTNGSMEYKDVPLVKAKGGTLEEIVDKVDVYDARYPKHKPNSPKLHVQSYYPSSIKKV